MSVRTLVLTLPGSERGASVFIAVAPVLVTPSRYLPEGVENAPDPTDDSREDWVP